MIDSQIFVRGDGYTSLFQSTSSICFVDAPFITTIKEDFHMSSEIHMEKEFEGWFNFELSIDKIIKFKKLTFLSCEISPCGETTNTFFSFIIKSFIDF